MEKEGNPLALDGEGGGGFKGGQLKGLLQTVMIKLGKVGSFWA